jgi:hypothetical protein
MGVKSRPKKNRLQIGTNFFALRTGCLPYEVGENEDMKFVPLLMATLLSPALLASDKETTKKPQSPIVIPVTGAGQSTTTKLGNS